MEHEDIRIALRKKGYYRQPDGSYSLVVAAVPDAKREIVVPFPTPKPAMNRTETELYGILKTRGYDKVAFEAVTLTLAAGARYSPDFYCVTKWSYEHVKGSNVTFYECKNNFIREASLVRLKVAARTYPEFQFILAQKKKGVWSERIIAP